MSSSYATMRKIRIIKEKLGDDWKADGRRIDAIYNELVGDGRKNLFCKISPTVKSHLDEMTDRYNIRMGELIERLIEDEFRLFRLRKSKYRVELARQFAEMSSA